MMNYTDGVYDSSLCLPQHDCEVTMYEALARQERPKTFVETLIRDANPSARSRSSARAGQR